MTQMVPLRVTARFRGALMNPSNKVALDALLTAAVVVRDELPPIYSAADITPIDVPIAMSECGRYRLASFSEQEVEDRELAYVNKPAIVREFFEHCGPKGTINIAAGENKGWRIPTEIGHLFDDAMTWWCIGDEVGVRALLALVHHVGKKRGHGRGAVAEWLVEPCESWGDGFPVMRDGRALRTLPRDYAGITSSFPGRGALRPPYWMRETYEEVVLP